jgi:DNA-binding GntR family transcriptional regulator
MSWSETTLRATFSMESSGLEWCCSRAPLRRFSASAVARVQRALELMAQEGLVHRFNGRGYLVGAASSGLEPIRVNLLTLNLDVSGDIQDYAQRAAWQRIYGEVADRVVACCPFGAYKISESVMCSHFDVSRTVVRDVLNRLNHDGLIEKDRWSHWTAGPLTSRDVKEHFEIRALLEPAA